MTSGVLWLAVLLMGVGVSGITPTAHAHQGHTHLEPWNACESHVLGDDCSWQNDTDHLYRGTCRKIGAALMCVRHKPIIHVSEVEQPITSPPDGEEGDHKLTLILLALATLCAGIGGIWFIKK
jgi:hypothetical protein